MEFHKYANLFALIEGKEFDLLVRDIKENGLNNPIVLYEGKILDGRNRYLACKEIGIEPETKVFNSGGDPLTFVLSENLRRRHLTTSQRAALAAEVANMTHGGNRKIDQSPNLDFDHSTKKVGELFNVSRSNIFEAKKIKSENQDLFNELKTGESTIQQAKREIVKKKRTESARSAEKIRLMPEDVDLRFGDFRKVLMEIPDGSVDLIVTDPPYPYEFINLYSDLAAFAKRKLKDNGFCVVYSGQFHLQEVMERLGEHLDYYWIFSKRHNNTTQLIHARNTISEWKPILLYQKNIKKMDGILADFIQTKSKQKEFHDWQQAEGDLIRFIEKLSDVKETVVDPFSGSGTTGVVSLRLKRKFIGSEIDREVFNLSKKRINDEV